MQAQLKLERRNPTPGRCRSIHNAAQCQHGCNPRFVAFLRAGNLDCRGGSMHTFLIWSHRMLSAFRRETGIDPSFTPRAYDAWLEKRTRRSARCPECFGDGHWNGSCCWCCDGSGLTEDCCHFTTSTITGLTSTYIGGLA